MRIEITPEARDYILKNDKAAYVLVGNITGCCGGKAPVPDIYVGSPKDTSMYEYFEVDGVAIYVDKNYESGDRIQISLSKLWKFKKLNIEYL